jgi:AraC-like DNA-binding protein
MVNPSELIELLINVYIILLCLFFTVYMVFAIRQYGRWLNDNYADLENKKVWLIQVVSLVCMLMFVLYTLATSLVLVFSIHIVELVLVGLLLWRVETLPELNSLTPDSAPIGEGSEDLPDSSKSTTELSAPLAPLKGVGGEALANIEQLMDERCVGGQLYLQHDLSLLQLAHTLGINRFYLSQYFSRQGTTYNAYINDLRIKHFMRLYREAVQNGQTIGAQQLANDSGYRSYSTFSLAFKQRMGKSVTAWMREQAS